ncbi:MAG TPA: hypothetical protein VNI78_11190 [Vicinamibacterales bacterium]|nr:hypothetical protein [Vicinamibacterales bacterium]
MLSMTPVRLTCAAAACLMAIPVFAQPLDRRTTFTFNTPVAIPGVTLPAGSYLFRVANPGVSQRVIQVVSADGKTPYAMFFSIPAERPEPAKEPEVRFMETAAGMPPAIRTWWYPGERMGYEFIYPKEQARKLAEGVKEPVLTTKAETTTVEQTNTEELARLGASGQETAVKADAAPTPASPTGTSQQGQIASADIAIPTPSVPQAPAGATQASRSARTRLPQTAGAVPAIALVGLASLAAAAAIRAWRR